MLLKLSLVGSRPVLFVVERKIYGYLLLLQKQVVGGYSTSSRGREKVNVIKAVKTIKAMADFETIKSKCGMSFFLVQSVLGITSNSLHSLFARPRRSDAWGVFGLASHVKDFPLIFYV